MARHKFAPEKFVPKTVYVTYIATTPEKGWAALTKSEFSKQYFFGQMIEGDWRIISAQANAQQDQQKNHELQGPAQFTSAAAADPNYKNADGSPNIQKFQEDAMKVAPVYGPDQIGRWTSNFKACPCRSKDRAAGWRERKEMAPQGLEKIDSATGNGAPKKGRSARPHGFAHLPLAFEDLTAASTNARPFTPSSIVGKCADFKGFLPTRAALMARATSE